jgi:hypothetical protein
MLKKVSFSQMKTLQRGGVWSVRYFAGGFKRAKGSGNDDEELGAADREMEKVLASDAADMFRFVQKAVGVQNKKISFTPEEEAEHRRIAEEFNRMTTLEDQRLMEDISTKCWLQQEAIKAIPNEELRAAALIIDESPPPPHRPFPEYDSPPIAGFDVKDFDGSRISDDDYEVDDVEDDGSEETETATAR